MQDLSHEKERYRKNNIMEKKILDFIKGLSRKDKKTLSQKALKVAEETGELASAVLPFESAHSTTHRFVDKHKILEEIADVFLTSISIAYELGFTDEDFETMVHQKTLKWAELQTIESKIEYPLPYEIHITVNNADKDSFISVCKALNVKPIVIDLQDNEGASILEDVMTSSKHFGDNTTAYAEMERISNGLTRSGFEVVRNKIETVPWHPAAPTEAQGNPIMPPSCYFESHIGVITTADKNLTHYQTLREIAIRFNSHLSRNAFKKLEDNNIVLMITYRTYTGTYEDFKKHTKQLRDCLRNNDYPIQNMVTEFSIYDSKYKHDSVWIS